MIKASIQEEAVSLVNIYLPNTIFKYINISIGRINSNTIIGLTPLPPAYIPDYTDRKATRK